MPAPTAKIDKGTFTDSPCVEEANMLVSSVTFTPQRDVKKYMSIVTGTNVWRRDSNASCKWDIKGFFKSAGGFFTQHVGTAVTTLANFSATFAGFDPAVGALTFVDGKHTWGTDRELEFSVEHDPHIA